MPNELAALFTRSQRSVHQTQAGLGKLLGISRRTAQRYSAQGIPSHYLPALARVVHPHDADLAREIAAHMGTTLEALGLAAPAAATASSGAGSPADAAPAALLTSALVDAVVCAASEAMNVLPADARKGLQAAFVRARELRLTVEAVEQALEDRRVGAKKAKAARRSR
jgi:hypothetical protein